MKFKVGISLRLGEIPDADENVLALAESSMKHVEIAYVPYCDDPKWTELVRKKLSKTSVNINSVHAPFSSEVDISRLDDGGQEFSIQQISKAIIMTERLGADLVVLHGSSEPIGENERDKRIAKGKSSLDILSKQAESAGVRLALELLPRTCLGNTADELQILLADLSPNVAGFCLDANHPADHNQLPSIVKQLGERIITLHISDYDGIDEKHWMPFKGVVDWAKFTNALDGIGYSGAFIYETNAEGNSVKERLENIQSNFDLILEAALKKPQ